MTGKKNGGTAHVRNSEGPWSESAAVPEQIIMMIEVPDGYTLPPVAAGVILRVMNCVAARETEARAGIGRAG